MNDQTIERVGKLGVLLASLSLAACGQANADRWAEGERRPVSVSSTETRLDLEIDQTGMYTIQSEGDLDVVCRLLDESGRQVAADDDSGEGMNCSMTVPLGPGQYQVEVVGFESDDKGQAQISYQAMTSQAVAMDEAVAITVGGPTGTAVAFEVAEDGGYMMTTSGQLDTVCALYNDQGAVIGSDDDSGDGMNCSLNQRLAAGAYQLVITTFNDQGGNATFMVAPYVVEAIPLETDTPASARIEESGGRVEFDLSISDSGRYSLSTTGDIDTVCELRTLAGALMGENDDDGDQNCRINHALPVGEYRFIVSGFSGTTGPFTAHLERR